MDTFMDLYAGPPLLNIHNLFTNEKISVYLDKHSHVSLDTRITLLISLLSKGVVKVASA